jgi:hypothetical protein
MIYLKKIDGTIEQHEDELRPLIEVDIRVQGESFGTLFTADSLPDEDKISLGLTTEAEVLKYSQDSAINELSVKCKTERANMLDDTKIINILSGATAGYPEYLTPENVAQLIETYKQIYHITAGKIQKATSKSDIEKIMKDLVFPTDQDIIKNIN